MFFREWNTDWGITWGMRYSVMFICIKTSSKEEGMITFTRAPLCTSLRCVTAQTQEPELIAAAQVNAWVGFISARFWTVPEMALQGIYSVICLATSKTAKTPFIIWISWRKINKFIRSAPIALWLVRRHIAQLCSRRPEFDSRLEVLCQSCSPLSCHLSTVVFQLKSP